MHRHRDITSPSRPPPSAESSVDKTSSDLALKNKKNKKKVKKNQLIDLIYRYYENTDIMKLGNNNNYDSKSFFYWFM